MILRSLLVVLFLLAGLGPAAAMFGVITSAGTNATMRVAGDQAPQTGARISIVQNDLFGAPLTSIMATVVRTEGYDLSLAADGDLVLGPAEFNLFDGEPGTDGSAGLPSSVGMSIGSLDPNFTLPTDEIASHLGSAPWFK